MFFALFMFRFYPSVTDVLNASSSRLNVGLQWYSKYVLQSVVGG